MCKTELLILPAGLLHLLSAPNISPASNAYLQTISRARLPTTSAAATLVRATTSFSPGLLYSFPSGVPASAPASSLVYVSKEQQEWFCYYVSQITSCLYSDSPRRSGKCQIFPSAFPTPIHPHLWQHLSLLPTPCAPASLASPLFSYTHQASPYLTGLCIGTSFHLEFSPPRLISSSLQLQGALPHFFPVSPSGQTTPLSPHSVLFLHSTSST